MEDKVPYEFETTPPDNFLLTLHLKANHKVFNQIMTGIYNRLVPKEKKVEINLSENYSFDVEERNLNLINTFMGSIIKKVYKDVGKDGIECFKSKVTKTTFIKKKEYWMIDVYVGGKCDKSGWTAKK